MYKYMHLFPDVTALKHAHELCNACKAVENSSSSVQVQPQIGQPILGIYVNTFA